ncbi:MAG: tRNA (adenosine(37)-N6)-threonylcarbamoyltransferase complex ATPase subunit type 1 TsaE [Thermoanaerobaculia bacterium]
MRSWRSASEDETRAVGIELAAELVPDGCLLLLGTLGSGKTVLTQGVARGLGFESTQIQSPTYTLVHEYELGGVRLVHADLFRVESSEIASLGLEETLAGPGVKVVEWADRLPFAVPGALWLRLSADGSGGRRIEEASESIQ